MATDPSRLAFIYTRVSQDREGGGLAVSRQLEDCERLARERGLTVVEHFSDNDVSAYTGKPRPRYRAMLARLSDVRSVIVWHTDRLHRDPTELEEWIVATGGDTAANVATLTVQAGDLDLNTADGRLRARISGAVARHESERKSERVRRKIADKVGRGEWLGGSVPFGWDAVGGELVLNEQEAGIVREFSIRVIQGASLGSLARELQESGRPARKPRMDGTPSKRIGRWTPERVKEMLLRARNAGLVELKNKTTGEMEVVGTTKAPAIVNETQWRAVVRKLTDPSRRVHTKANRPIYLLGGIGRCNCGALLRSASSSSGGRIYKCSLTATERAATGPHTSRSQKPVDEVVRDCAVAVLSNQAFIESLTAPGASAERQLLNDELAEVEAQEQDVLATVGKSRIAGPVLIKLAEERERIEQALADLEERDGRAARADAMRAMAAVSQFDLFLHLDARGTWDSWSVDRQRDWIRQNLKVTIRPEIERDPRTFCRESVEVLLWDGSPIPSQYALPQGSTR
jgi:DNA invertase Pin-like site-specific DNA recombinase